MAFMRYIDKDESYLSKNKSKHSQCVGATTVLAIAALELCRSPQG